MDHYDHHRILGAGEAESRAAVFERLSVEKFMDSIEDEEESNAKRDKVGELLCYNAAFGVWF